MLRLFPARLSNGSGPRGLDGSLFPALASPRCASLRGMGALRIFTILWNSTYIRFADLLSRMTGKLLAWSRLRGSPRESSVTDVTS